MAARIDGAAEQIEEALDHLARAPWRMPDGPPPSLLAVGAMGGSAIAADLCAAVWGDRLRHPLLVVRDDRWPGCVAGDALAALVSYSGGTEETLALWDQAVARGVRRVAMATGGELARRCDRDGTFCMGLPAGSPPRAALWAAWPRVAALLHALGWIDDPGAAWRGSAAALRALRARIGTAVPEASNPAKQLARALHGRHVLVYAGARGAAAATRWRQQLNENAKLPAHSAAVPELNHNEIVSWERAGAFHAQASVVVLHDPEASAGERVRLTLTAEFARGCGAGVHEVWAEGGSPLARAATLVGWGDHVSLYLALLGGVDPTPIASIDAFKRRLAESARAAHEHTA
jgi:glucose/mannose-6-phosphate isomerase